MLKKIKALKIKNNTGKKAKKNSLVLGLLFGVVVVAFIFRTFYETVAPMLGADPGMFRVWADLILGYALGAGLLYVGFMLIGNPILGFVIGGAGLIVVFLNYLKMTGKE